MYELRDSASAGDPADSTAGKSRCPSTDVKPLICTEGSAAGNSQPARLESTASFHSSPEIARFVGKFRVIKLVGRGAFGEVYQAYDTELHRYVALKLPRAGALSQPDESTFLREAKNVSRLQHPGIVPVYDVGRTEQCCFIVSEFVEGITLAQEIRGKRLAVADAALIVAQLAEALDHAHRQGVIHRDLKPSNILLDRRRETGSSSIRLLNGLPDQQPLFPRIVDFGLGKRSMADASISLDAHVLGTPSYMSPEQAAGNSDRVDGRSDVYSLGVILYELLVGVVPFRGETLLSQVLYDPPSRLRAIDRTVPRDLEVTCLKCLEKEPRRRYQTAGELAEDLRRWLEGMPIQARPVSHFERAVRYCWRRSLLTTSVAALVLLTVATAISGWWLHTARQQLVATRIQNLLAASPTQVGGALSDIRELLPDVAKPLRLLRTRENLTDRQRLLIDLALSEDTTNENEFPLDGLLTAHVDEFPVLCREAAPHAETLTTALWKELLTGGDDARCLRAACALAHLDSQSPGWSDISAKVAWLLASAKNDIRKWGVQLEPVKSLLFSDLKNVFTSTNNAQQETGSAVALAAMFADRTGELCSLLLFARDSQFRTVIDALQKHRSDAVAILKAPIITIEELRPGVQTDEPAVVKTANRVLGLMALGAGDELWPLWDAASDPRLQTYLIHGYYLKRLPPDLLSQQLRSIADRQAGVQYALLLSLGGFAPADLAESERVKLIAWLLDRYQTHPDSGVHAGIRWVLKQWGAIDKTAIANARLIAEGFNENRGWYLNSLGQMMVVIRPESPSLKPISGDRTGQRGAAELTPFAIAATETTWKEFITLLPDKDRMPGIADDEPVRGLSWFDAAEYCRRLSEREEMDAQCDSIIVSNRPLEETAAVNFMLTGYRPPRRQEWEYAARAGTRTERFFGSTQTAYAPAYLWHSKVEDRAAVVGGLRPNGFGLFDVYGNVREWTSTPFGLESVAASGQQGGRLLVEHLTNLGHCGGDFTTPLGEYKSTTCDPNHAGRPVGFNFHGFGIRIARTLP